METLLALEMVRVTEAAAIASARLMGRGDKDGADRAATEAMRTADGRGRDARHHRHRRGRARRGADALDRRAGRARAARATWRSTSRSTRWRAPTWWPSGQPNAITVLAASEARRPAPRAGHLPREAVRGPGRGGPRGHHARAHRQRARHRRSRCAATCGTSPSSSSTGRATRRSSRRSASTGARIKLISDGDLSAAISCAVSGTGVHGVMGIGGAPEGVLTAAALKCLGGEIQARFRFRNDEERARAERMGTTADETHVFHTNDLAPGENLVFAASGVTQGDLLDGVRFFGGGARTHSLVMAYQTAQVRFVDTVHMFDRTSPPAVRL